MTEPVGEGGVSGSRGRCKTERVWERLVLFFVAALFFVPAAEMFMEKGQQTLHDDCRDF